MTVETVRCLFYKPCSLDVVDKKEVVLQLSALGKLVVEEKRLM